MKYFIGGALLIILLVVQFVGFYKASSFNYYDYFVIPVKDLTSLGIAVFFGVFISERLNKRNAFLAVRIEKTIEEIYALKDELNTYFNSVERYVRGEQDVSTRDITLKREVFLAKLNLIKKFITLCKNEECAEDIVELESLRRYFLVIYARVTGTDFHTRAYSQIDTEFIKGNIPKVMASADRLLTKVLEIEN